MPDFIFPDDCLVGDKVILNEKTGNYNKYYNAVGVIQSIKEDMHLNDFRYKIHLFDLRETKYFMRGMFNKSILQDQSYVYTRSDQLKESIIKSVQYIHDEALLEKMYEELLIKYQEYS